MVVSNPEQIRGSGGNDRLMRTLKKNKRVALAHPEGGYYKDVVTPKNHGIKEALLERPLVADTSVILQNLIVEVLHTTTEENVRKLIITAMKKIKWETELFTKQLERHIVEAEIGVNIAKLSPGARWSEKDSPV